MKTAATVLAAGSMLGYGSWRQAQEQNAAPAAVVAGAVGLGVLSAYLAVGHYLRLTRPVDL